MNWRAEASAQIRLAVPVVLINLAMMAMGAVDVAVVGHDGSAVALAAISLGHAAFWCATAGGVGVLLSMDPLVSQAVGAHDVEGVAKAMQRGLLAVLLLSVPLTIFLAHVDTLLGWLDQPAELLPGAASYAWILAAGVPPLLAFGLFRQSLQAMGRVRTIMVVAVLANVVNLVLDLALIRGAWGFPALGGDGCAWATVGSEWFMLLTLVLFERRRLAPALWPWRRASWRPRPFLRLLRLGLPIGVTLSVEAGAFNAVTFLAGSFFGTQALAGHRVALTIASISFMVPLGISTAAAVRVGHGVGAQDVSAVRVASRVALVGGGLAMAVCGLTFLLLPRALSAVFTDEAQVLAIAASLLPVAAVFQIFDGLQVVAAGVLRGMGETRWPMVLNLVGYWVLGLPLGVAMVRWGGAGPVALWWGLALGLVFVAITLLWRVRSRLTVLVARIDLEDPGDPDGHELPAGA